MVVTNADALYHVLVCRWPVYLSLVTDQYRSKKCGTKGQTGKVFSPFATPKQVIDFTRKYCEYE